jgi:hypothetical protein
MPALLEQGAGSGLASCEQCSPIAMAATAVHHAGFPPALDPVDLIALETTTPSLASHPWWVDQQSTAEGLSSMGVVGHPAPRQAGIRLYLNSSW